VEPYSTYHRASAVSAVFDIVNSHPILVPCMSSSAQVIHIQGGHVH
jgi:hypothetical protein